jgi:hypothetical protein
LFLDGIFVEMINVPLQPVTIGFGQDCNKFGGACGAEGPPGSYASFADIKVWDREISEVKKFFGNIIGSIKIFSKILIKKLTLLERN